MGIRNILKQAADNQVNLLNEVERNKLADEIQKEYMGRLLAVRGLLQVQNVKNLENKRCNSLQIIDNAIDAEIEDVCLEDVNLKDIGNDNNVTFGEVSNDAVGGKR